MSSDYTDRNNLASAIKTLGDMLEKDEAFQRLMYNASTKGEINRGRVNKVFLKALLSAGDKVGEFLNELIDHLNLFKVLGDFSWNPPVLKEAELNERTSQLRTQQHKYVERVSGFSHYGFGETGTPARGDITSPRGPQVASIEEDLATSKLAELLLAVGDHLEKIEKKGQFLPENVERFSLDCFITSESVKLSSEAVELAPCYTEPVIIQRSKEQTEKYCQEYVRSPHTSSHLLSNDKTQSIRIGQLFSPDSDGNTPKTVILCGDSGRGKSFVLEKIILDWVHLEHHFENFDAVFLLKYEELKCLSEEMSLTELLSRSCSLTSDQISQILQLTPEKVLFLIDGIDDFSFNAHIQISSPTDPSQKAPVISIIHCLMRDLLLVESSVIVTTRYTAAAELSSLCKRPQRFTEIEGFSERRVQEYFQKFFQDEQLFKKAYESMKTNETLLTFCSVPLLCWMVCFCLKKDADQVMTELKTTTSIYVHFVSTLLEDHHQSQSFLRSLGQLAEEGMKNRQNLFDEKSVTRTGLDPATRVFMNKIYLKRKKKHELLFKFKHLSFQEFFAALYYIMLDEEESWCKVSELFNMMESEALIHRSPPIFRGRLSNPIPSVMMFLCGLFNKKVSSSLFEKMKSTFSHNVKLKKKELKKKLMKMIPAMIRQYGFELFALHCLYELQDERFVTKVLETHKFIDLSNVSLRSTDCLVLCYCLRLCPNIRELNFMNCDLTAAKLKILQPALGLCETLRFSVEHLSEIGDLIQILSESKILRELKVREDEYGVESPRWSFNLSVTRGDVLLTLSSSEKNPSFSSVLNIRLTCAQSQISRTDWTLFLQRLRKTGTLTEDSSADDDHVSLQLSSLHSVGLKSLDLTLVSLNESWASGIISLIQNCTSLQQLKVSVTGLLLEEGLKLLKKSLTDPHCTVIIEGRRNCSEPSEEHLRQSYEKVEIHFKPKLLEELAELSICNPGSSALNIHCQSCVDVADSDQWVQVEPSVCRGEGGTEFRITTPAGRFQCSRTRMRWVCDGDVTLHYRAVDGHFLNAELERLQCERVAPVLDVNVISGKLEEAHLPHYMCLAESDPALTNAVKLLSVEDEGISLESVELTRFHAKILQPMFSPKTVLVKLGIPVKVHCDLLIFMTHTCPIILNVYFFPSDSLVEENIKTEEKSSHQIKCSRPEAPLQMKKQHSLEVPDAVVQPEAIKLRGNMKPNFFQVKQPVVNDITMILSRVDDQKSVWTGTIWKKLIDIKLNKTESDLFQSGQKHKTSQPAHSFDKAQFFDTHWCNLIKSVENVDTVADKLLQKQIIHEQFYSEIIHHKSTSEESMRKICVIVRKGSAAVKEIFISILLQENPNLLNHLPSSDS
ncbi:NACHT, LRR and PYD domains-containing protein 1 homolog [Danio rerio]|uniref:NACHT, LRR and PYD domains-containing protein 1 homolog n=2 Tax=Danio rerio TaxID=7955 RepID=NLRP1_DANRE|nr:NACHT, LRR and PYD domains-containing protein 1 homolog [Danio rerio]A0A386CAB9.1 RecName: Full=NACHT, LRR and PYD domains-containing protein 1 homolog; Contains: RecName: Full=NACHT, LRR and PYD domains-containing protein 1, C-terminus; Short=NLRP1-CT; Contains: RecName: Full=NACHT, LRR and PYD domains-containing protein 1, N-terminus; Short=NLRP1-NT [Danio rerio]AYC80945.1 NLR family pyrin domain containing 1 [Danio rerio]|eukprot:XP_009297081.1 NACHT, LRR and PYD domains-containing protein 3-like isoform X1 [Danio rerio]